MPEDKVTIFDTTLRDGEQSAGIGLTTPEKLEIARQLDRLGVDVIEAGFAASSPGDFEAVQAIVAELHRPVIASLARCVPGDVDSAWEAIKDAKHPRIHVFISSSDVQIMHQLRKNPEEVLDMAVASVERAKGYCEDVEFSPMDATRTDMEYLYMLLEAAINAGATTVNIPDTVGYAMPWEFGERIEHIKQNVPNIDKAVISVHCHNDLGLSVASSLAAVVAGARQVEGCINGLGERAGNASLEEVIMGIETRKDFLGVSTNVDTPADIPDQQAGKRHHRLPCPAQQGHSRRQCLSPRFGHPPGWCAEGAHHLRDHGPAVHRLAKQHPGVGQAQRARGTQGQAGGNGVQAHPGGAERRLRGL